MVNLLLIDDHPGLLPDQVSHVFHAPAHRVEIARTALRAFNMSPTFGQTRPHPGRPGHRGSVGRCSHRGIYFTKPFTDYTAEDFKAFVSTNLGGFLYVTQPPYLCRLGFDGKCYSDEHCKV